MVCTEQERNEEKESKACTHFLRLGFFCYSCKYLLLQERVERTEGEERVTEKKVSVSLNLKKMVSLFCGGFLCYVLSNAPMCLSHHVFTG